MSTDKWDDLEARELERTFLVAHARNLAVLCLQSKRYGIDPDFRDEVDRVLELTDRRENGQG